MTTSAADAYLRFAPAILGYLRGQGAADPEDLLSEVFLQVARSLPRFRGADEELRPWIFAIARNRLIDDRRRRQRRPIADSRPVPDRPDVPGHDPFDEELLAALARLTADQREVVVLRYVGDLSLEEAAQLTKRTIGAVKAMQHRALSQLARILEGSAVAVDGDD